MRQIVYVIGICLLIVLPLALVTKGERALNVAESGDRLVTTLYPKPVASGQWVLFLASDKTQREAFVRCRRALKVGDTIVVESNSWRYRNIVLYAARCT